MHWGVLSVILNRIDENRLLIALSSEDMELLNITFKQLDWNNEYSREIIKNLLLRAKKEMNFSIDSNKVLIEAIPQKAGCFVLITLLARANGKRKIYKVKEPGKPFVFSFECLEDLLCSIERIYSKRHPIFSSSIVKCKNDYYMILNINGSISSKLEAIMSEYGRLAGRDSLSVAQLYEQGEVIAKDNAIEVLGKHLVRKR